MCKNSIYRMVSIIAIQFIKSFQSVAHVIQSSLEIPNEDNGVSHHTIIAENRSVETVFTPTNVCDDTSENDSDYRLSTHAASQWTTGLTVNQICAYISARQNEVLVR